MKKEENIAFFWPHALDFTFDNEHRPTLMYIDTVSMLLATSHANFFYILRDAAKWPLARSID